MRAHTSHQENTFDCSNLYTIVSAVSKEAQENAHDAQDSLKVISSKLLMRRLSTARCLHASIGCCLWRRRHNLHKLNGVSIGIFNPILPV
jgi:hypothetical protein